MKNYKQLNVCILIICVLLLFFAGLIFVMIGVDRKNKQMRLLTILGKNIRLILMYTMLSTVRIMVGLIERLVIV